MDKGQRATNRWAAALSAYPGPIIQGTEDARSGSAPVPPTRHQVQATRRAVHRAKTRRVAWHILGWAMTAALGVVCYVLFHVRGTLAYFLTVAAEVALIGLVIALWPRRRTGRSVDVPRGPAPEVTPGPAVAPEPVFPVVAAPAIVPAPGPVPAVAPAPAAPVVTTSAAEHPSPGPMPSGSRDGIDVASAATANTAAARAVRLHLQRSRGTARGGGTSRRVRQVLAWALASALVALWFVGFRPQALGGPTEYVGVSGISMTPTMHNGDLAVVEKQASYRMGDIVVYHVPPGQPDAGKIVIHRIVGGNGTTGFVTEGDHNLVVDPWHPRSANVVGRVWFHVPGALHWVMVVAVGVVAILLAMSLWPRRRTHRSVAIPQGPTSARQRRVLRAGAPGPERVTAPSSDGASVVPATASPSVAEPAPVPIPEVPSMSAPPPVPAVAPEPGKMVGTVPADEPAPASEQEPVRALVVEQEPEAPGIATSIVETPTVSPSEPITAPADSEDRGAQRVASPRTATPDDTEAAVAPLDEPVGATEPEVVEVGSPPAGSYWDRTRARRAPEPPPDQKNHKRHQGRRRRLPQT